jgi:hypothetical protein
MRKLVLLLLFSINFSANALSSKDYEINYPVYSNSEYVVLKAKFLTDLATYTTKVEPAVAISINCTVAILYLGPLDNGDLLFRKGILFFIDTLK